MTSEEFRIALQNAIGEKVTVKTNEHVYVYYAKGQILTFFFFEEIEDVTANSFEVMKMIQGAVEAYDTTI